MPARALKRANGAARSPRSVSAYLDFLPFCLATNIGQPPSGPKWIHEIKFDGYRSQVHIRDGEVTIYTKNGHDWTERYRSVAEEARKLKIEHVVIDGEMVAMRDDQTCDMWALLRDTRNGISERLTFVAFDLLFLKGEDLRQQPLLARKQKLRELLGAADLSRIKYSEHLEYDEQKNVDGPNIWTNVHGVNVEGIVSKRIDSCYRSQGGDDWIKTPCQYREVLPIVGMAMDGEKLGGLYLARKQSGSLLYAGQLEEGLNDEIRADLLDKLTPFVTKRPTVETYTVKTDATWLQPVARLASCTAAA
jgi:bifunctional non-homologous end joining protein LigD